MQDNDTVKGNRDKAVALVPSAKQAADALRQKWRFAEAGVWTDNMFLNPHVFFKNTKKSWLDNSL